MEIRSITAHNYYSADYTIKKPNGFIVKKPQDRYWTYSEETINKYIKENRIIWGEGNAMPTVKDICQKCKMDWFRQRYF